MTEREKYLEKLRHELVLLFEYDTLKKKPSEFINSFDLLLEQQNPQIQEIKTFDSNTILNKASPSGSKSLGFIEHDDILRLKNGNYLYIPTKKQYINLYSCLEDLRSRFDLEKIFQAFSWQEFETFAVQCLDVYGYISHRTFRFSTFPNKGAHKKKRHEVDIIARDGTKILFIDAKHWALKTASNSALIRVALEQITRAQHLASDPKVIGDLLHTLHYSDKSTFHTFFVYPLILVSSLLPTNTIVNGVPIISISRFNEFLMSFSALQLKLKPISLSRASFQRKLK